ncbi:hypothetical protein [Penaeicola halotolerans]|uniref:hypothetical protein n=1 Tax=Penaeicola halotolerans TaxID=2793196 RepID=UPI001CF8C4C5|nr:hypothetical protein [Penaeicola halotolerans]
MKKLLFSLCFFVILMSAQAQDQPLPATQAVYVELGGAGLSYSFNYDFRFDKTKIDSWGMRVGASGYSLEGTSLFTFPIQVTRLFGRDGRYFEIGGGLTVMAFDNYYYSYDCTGAGPCVETKVRTDDYNFILDVNGSPNVMGTLNFGYRKIPTDGGFMWRVNLNPIFNSNGFWPIFAGLGFGYAF